MLVFPALVVKVYLKKNSSRPRVITLVLDQNEIKPKSIFKLKQVISPKCMSDAFVVQSLPPELGDFGF